LPAVKLFVSPAGLPEHWARIADEATGKSAGVDVLITADGGRRAAGIQRESWNLIGGVIE
jgi:hypothetical protein